MVVLVGGGLLVARLAGATTVIAHSFSTLVQEVEVIAVGTVTAIETEWGAQQGAPFTLVTFSELTVLKGEGGQAALTLHFLGGPTPDERILVRARLNHQEGRAEKGASMDLILRNGRIAGQEEVRACFDMVTQCSAQILGLEDYGVEVGKAAGLVVLDCATPEAAVAEVITPVYGFKRGRQTFTRKPAELHRP